MLAQRHLELLTAFVDGELSRRQRKAVMRLLHRSSEARSVVQDLQETVHRLRDLPQRTLGENFSRHVVQVIADRDLRPAPERPVWRRRLYWAGYAAAAALLLAVGTGIYLVSHQAPQASSELAASASHGKNEGRGARDEGREEKKPEPVAVPPIQVTFEELARKPARDVVSNKLRTEGSFHLDLRVSDNGIAVKHLRSALQGQGIKIIVDPRTEASLANGAKTATEYFVYAENVRIDELETLLWQFADDSKDPARPRGIFESMSVHSLSGEDRARLARLFGVTVADLAPPPKPDDSLRFENKIIEATKENGKPAPPLLAPAPERYAMVMAGGPGHSGTSSEIAKLLASRRQHRPGSVQVLLVIRLA